MSDSYLTLLVTVLAVVLPVVLAVVVTVFTVRRIRRDPRRLGNAYWLLATTLLLGWVLGVAGSGGNPVFGALGLLIVLSPLITVVFAVFCVLNGAVMLRRERFSLGNSLSLLTGLAIIGLLVAVWPVLALHSLVLRALWLACLLAAAFLAFQFAAFLGYARLYRWLVRDRPADWVVVLGSGLHGSEVPPLLASRIATGMDELTRRGAGRLVLSGGKGDDERLAEGEAMARWAAAHGADPAVLTAETASRTTEENLRFSSALVGDGPGVIVTSNYHAFRAALLARRLGVDAQAVGAPTAGYYWPSAVLREFVAVLREYRVANAVLLALVAVPVPLVLVLVAG
ncbi:MULTISPECIES: YdcF family protein [unclassified Pseudonocardia]|uniref:YdcF family protein n=1 Tax=unclassified Pseudonocardia TaxID=2619320 RepID=UPI001CF67490|nr:YdcF family protein [Pseudonocardia sp. ICBG601]